MKWRRSDAAEEVRGTDERIVITEREPNTHLCLTTCCFYLFLFLHGSIQKTAILSFEDRVFLYGKPSRISRAITACKNTTWR